MGEGKHLPFHAFFPFRIWRLMKYDHTSMIVRSAGREAGPRDPVSFGNTARASSLRVFVSITISILLSCGKQQSSSSTAQCSNQKAYRPMLASCPYDIQFTPLSLSSQLLSRLHPGQEQASTQHQHRTVSVSLILIVVAQTPSLARSFVNTNCL